MLRVATSQAVHPLFSGKSCASYLLNSKSAISGKIYFADQNRAVIPQFGMEVTQTKLNKRTHYSESVLRGSTVHDLKNKAKDAIEEIEKFATEIIDILK